MIHCYENNQQNQRNKLKKACSLNVCTKELDYNLLITILGMKKN